MARKNKIAPIYWIDWSTFTVIEQDQLTPDLHPQMLAGWVRFPGVGHNPIGYWSVTWNNRVFSQLPLGTEVKMDLLAGGSVIAVFIPDMLRRALLWIGIPQGKKSYVMEIQLAGRVLRIPLRKGLSIVSGRGPVCS